jgi:hypothetical protein
VDEDADDADDDEDPAVSFLLEETFVFSDDDQVEKDFLDKTKTEQKCIRVKTKSNDVLT